MEPLLHSFALMIRFVGTRTADSDRTATEASQRIVDALGEARITADAECERFEAALAAAQAATISEVSAAIAESAEAALTRRVRVLDRNAVLAAAALFVVAGGACLGGGYQWGSRNALASVHQTEAGLRAAFATRPADAVTWMNLMEWNSIRDALNRCSRPDTTFIAEDGRRACSVPLWIEPPHLTAPR